MKRGPARISVLIAMVGLCLRASAATDPFLQLSPPIVTTNGQVQLTLKGETDVPYVIEAASDAQGWSPVHTNYETASTRLISLPASNSPSFYRAGRDLLPAFPALIVAKQKVNLGSYLSVTSYDSADPAHDDPSDPNEVKAGADVYCEGEILATNAVIHGKIKTPGMLSVSNSIIGDLSWTNREIVQPGWYQDDYRFALPDVAPPSTVWGTPLLTPSNTWHFDDGDYKHAGALPFPNNGSRTFVVASGVVRLWVTGDFYVPGTWSMNISNGATFKLYVGDGSGSPVKARFGDVYTGGTEVAAFQYFGLPNNKSVSWFGSDVLKGVIYAPQAAVAFGGGGKDAYDFVGACVADSVVAYGHYNFHFDENVKRIGPFR